MILKPIKTDKVLPNSIDLRHFLDTSIKSVNERSVVVITSKVVAICENQVLPTENVDREKLIRAESDLFHNPKTASGTYEFHFTIVNDTLIPASGIDESNGNGYYILWPKDPNRTANEIRHYLMERFNLSEVGVLISDSTIFPSRWGTLGLAIGYSGFKPSKNYIGSQDLFGRKLKVSESNIAGGLAAAAVLEMGEGSEQTPIVLIEDLPYIDFCADDPTAEELKAYYISPLKDAPFAPFFNNGSWQAGGRSKE